MSPLEQQFREDKLLRDAAKANFFADLEHVKGTFSGKGLAERVVDRIGEGAKDVFETAKESTEDNRGIIAALVGAILLWISREPILEVLGLKEFVEDDTVSDPEVGEDAPDPDTISPGEIE